MFSAHDGFGRDGKILCQGAFDGSSAATGEREDPVIHGGDVFQFQQGVRPRLEAARPLCGTHGPMEKKQKSSAVN